MEIHNVIAKSSEEFITVSIKVKVGNKIGKGGTFMDLYYTIKFIDSFKFLSGSLDKLVESGKEGCEDPSENFPTIKKYFPENCGLLLRKGVYPYEYFTDPSKMLEEELPLKEEFYSKLRLEGIKDEEYEHTQNVYKTFKCKNLADYTKLYCLSDVLLLADIWKVFSGETLKTYGLDPGHYITLRSLSWDAMLKYTEAELELISDPTIHQHIESSIHGGISMIVKRYSHANNRYLSETYNPKKPYVYILYLDKNNLYCYAMSQPLPVSGFRFATEEEILNVDVSNLLPGFYNVNLEYLEELHDLHNDFPCTPEHIGEGNARCLLSGLNDKENYYVHYRLLETYLRLGLKLKKVNSIIYFREEAFMKPYIERTPSFVKRV